MQGQQQGLGNRHEGGIASSWTYLVINQPLLVIDVLCLLVTVATVCGQTLSHPDIPCESCHQHALFQICLGLCEFDLLLPQSCVPALAYSTNHKHAFFKSHAGTCSEKMG